jgi:adenine/guanine phosphoribosyltransferase-like PRPP-binding protein
MATYRFPQMLTLLAWEEELRHGSYALEWAWAEITPGDRLTLDFSRVEFADFGALARALLLLDAAVKSEIPAIVVLPDTSLIAASEPGDPEAAQAARQARTRGDALAFMRQVGFVDSLRAPHWDPGAVRILDRSVTASPDTGAATPASGPDSDRAPYRRRRVFPFRWLEPMPAAQLRESDSFLAVSAGLEDLGLSQSDARTLSQTVLTELVENVAAHGRVGDRPAMALVGAILLTAETYNLRQNGIHPHMAEVAERALTDHSQVLRLIVADSGADLAASLEPERARIGTDWDLDGDRRRQATILRALGSRPAGPAPGAGGLHGATGLWWVARVVRSYHGAVQARTADLLAARLFGRKAEGTNIALAGLGHVPGTLLELTLPTGATPRRPRTLAGSHHVPGAAPNLDMVICAFDPQRGLADDDRARLTEQLRAGRADRSADGLIITVSLHDDDRSELDNHWRGAIYQILEFASSIARAGMVVVVIPDAQPQLLDPCVAAFNEELAAVPGADRHEPIPVLGSRGDLIWCGGSAPLRELLSTLSEGYGALEVTEAFQLWQEVGGDRARFPEMLLTSGHLLAANTGRLQVRLSLSAIQATVERAVRRSVARAVGQGGPGVERGVFRGPTLQVTNRWISVEPLLTGTVGTELAAFVLARKTEAAVRASAQGAVPTVIVQVRSAPRALARYLSEGLALGGRFYPQSSELNIGEPLISEQVPEGARIVLCTDLISTENTIRRAVAMVADRKAHPLVVACAVDARDSPGPIRMLNRVIPVVSLAEVRVRLDESAGEYATNIDPLMLRPEDPTPADPAAAAEADLISWFTEDPDALRLGHIDDPPRRHYSAFVRLQALRPRERPDQITGAVLSNVRQILADVRVQNDSEMSPPASVAIWYVSSDGNAERLSGVVRDHLIAGGAEIGPPTAVPRWPAGDSWAFPASLGDVGPGVGVLIIHWWAITGSTLLQLVRLAARSGASWIAALCVLNQLDDNDADTLRGLRAFARPPKTTGADAASPAAGGSSAQVPVAIRFVANSDITAFDAHDCPMCTTTRERYRLIDDTVPPRLVSHAERLREMLRPRQLDEVARDSAVDLFTVPVTGAETVDYVRWRGLLLRALRSVPSRQEVIDRLRDLAGESTTQREWTSVGLIRLLAAEQQWLRLPPLHFGVAADLLSDICVRSFERVTVSPWLRAQFLMVLSATRPGRLVELLPELMALAGNEAVLLDQMLFDCCRLLLRSPGDLPIDLAQLRRSLLACRDYLEGRSAEDGAASAGEHVYVVRSLLAIADYRILRTPQDSQAAWDRLREDLVRPVIRHRLEAELLVVRSFVEDCEWVEPSPETARAAVTDWDTCARQLEERALVNLPPLRDILDGDFVSDQLGRRDQRRLLSLARPGVGELRAVTDGLHTLIHAPWHPADPSWLAGQRELLDRINWWNRIFLAAHVTDQERPALLVELIDSAPRELGPCVAELLAAHQAEATVQAPELGQFKVFCPEKLLDQILTHLLDNTKRHGAPDAEAPCRLEVEYLPQTPDTLPMVVRNSGTTPSDRPGRGLQALNEKLQPFGGSLTHQALPHDEPDSWTFAVTVTLSRWHGE